MTIKTDLVLAGLVFLLTLLLLVTSSCKHEPQVLPKTDLSSENGSGNGNGNGNGNSNGNGNGNQTSNCDSDSMYFQNTILPLIVSSCAKSGCHDAISHEDGIVLDNYQNIMNHGEIRPGNPGNSDLFELITENDPDDVMPPPPFAPLSQADIDKIALWINQGAQNNSCSDATCDSSFVSYSANILPILQSKCTGCHNSTLASGQVNLTGYSNAVIYAQNGRLLGAISHDAGFIAMPPAGSQLSDCEIALVRTWIRNGSPNN